MKFNKNLIIILAFVTLISSCGSVRESLSGAKQDNYDEFTVKNKDPLIIPPNFDDLPEPEGVGVNNKSESVNLDFSGILKSSKTEIHFLCLNSDLGVIIINGFLKSLCICLLKTWK